MYELQRLSFDLIKTYKTITSNSSCGVKQVWTLKKSKDRLCPSPPAIALKHLSSLPSTQLLPIQS